MGVNGIGCSDNIPYVYQMKEEGRKQAINPMGTKKRYRKTIDQRDRLVFIDLIKNLGN